MDYSSMILKKIKQGHTVTCRYCGASVVTFGGTAFCPNCELIAKEDADGMKQGVTDPNAADSLRKINELCSKGNYKDADIIYQSIIDSNSDPAFLYTYGLFCIRYSNAEHSKVSYSQKGFMEDNIGHIDGSSKIYAKAKMLMYKCADSIRRDKDMDPLIGGYMTFLSMIKLGRNAAARVELEKMSKLDGGVYGYASTVFDSYSGDFDSVIKRSEKNISSGKFQNNTPFYLAFALFKKGRFKESEKIARTMNSNVPNQRYESIISDIKKATSID